MPSDEVFYRVRIEGQLETVSALHVGDGGSLHWEDRLACLPDGRAPPDIQTQPEYHSVCWSEARGRPYLPGSSLRGSLRNLLPPDDPLTRRWFGFVEPPEAGGGRAGRVRVYDAFLSGPVSFVADAPPPYWHSERMTAARHGIALDAITGSVAEERLFSHELVPAGSVFGVEIEADDMDAAGLAKLLGLLARWDGGLWSALGGKRGKGLGRVRWQPGEVLVMTRESLAGWLTNDDALIEAAFLPLEKARPGLAPAAPPADPRRPVEIGYRLVADGPILVNEPGYVCKRLTAEEKERGAEIPPTHEHSRRPDGRAIVPGKSLIGVLRARARRIVATIAHQHGNAAPADATAIGDELIDRLFGDPDHRGALWLSDAEADPDPEPQRQPSPHPQFFNAIDRFTGGVKGEAGEGALFQVNASADGSYCGTLLLETARLTAHEDEAAPEQADWWKGLLLLVTRDAIEGDLAIGWGKAKGYGSFRAEFQGFDGAAWIGDWQTLQTALEGYGDLAAWVRALHAKILRRCGDLSEAAQARQEFEPVARAVRSGVDPHHGESVKEIVGGAE